MSSQLVAPRWLTSHRAVLIALAALVVASLVVSVADVEFAYRPGQLLLSLVLCVVVSGVVTYACAALVRVPPGAYSWLITALILYFILPGVVDAGAAWTVVLGCAAAAVSKYVLVWRGRLIVNPAVAGAVVVYVCAYAQLGSISYPQWWVAAEPLLIPMIVIGVWLVTVIHEWFSVAVFLAAALITIGVLELVQGGQDLSVWLVSSPMFFVAAVMMPEPLTSPAVRLHRGIYAVLIGVLMYCQQSIPVGSSVSIEFVPEVALLIGSLYAFVVRMLATRGAGRVRLSITDVAEIAPGTFSVSVSVKASRRIPFAAGQWAQLSTPRWSPSPGYRSRRVFSFASEPSADAVSFAFTTGGTPSEFKADIIEGRTLTMLLDDVGGDFVLGARQRPTVLVASGIGITPIRSMVREELSEGGELSWLTVVHVVRNENRVVYTDDLTAAESRGARVLTVVSAELAAGLDIDSATGLLQGVSPSAHVYLSGSPQFVRVSARSVRSVLPATRWARWRVHTDAFLGY